MKLRAQHEGLAVIATIVTANLPKDTVMAITANLTMDRGGLNAIPVGRLVVPSKTAGGQGTVETRFKERVEVKCSGAVAAGDVVKLAAPDGTTGETVVTKWTGQTDAVAGDKPETRYGVCFKGGADGAVIEVLTY